MRIYEAKRENAINQIINSLHHKNINEDKLLLTICSEYGCSKRTAKEYLLIAKHKYGTL